jgi:hypothetical protein
MRRAARLAESWSRVLGGQPMTFGVAHMKPRRYIFVDDDYETQEGTVQYSILQ